MADLLDTGAIFLARMQGLHASRDVTYARGADSVTVAATKGQSRFEVTDDTGTSTLLSEDFIIAPALLVLDGTTVLPEPGDRITDGGVVYEVMAIPGEPHWRYTDQYRHQVRIHTKIVG